jgi:hypothetical protein
MRAFRSLRSRNRKPNNQTTDDDDSDSTSDDDNDVISGGAPSGPLMRALRSPLQTLRRSFGRNKKNRTAAAPASPAASMTLMAADPASRARRSKMRNQSESFQMICARLSSSFFSLYLILSVCFF